jgi:WS/DGAT/MGAT family acyltransferase
MSLLRAGLRHHLVRALGLALGLSGLLRRPRRWLELPSRALRCARAVSHAALPLAPRSRLNGPLSVDRHLAWSSRSLDDLNAIKRHFDTTLNDAVLAASAGALRSLMRERGEGVRDLKAMVPVSVRHPEERWGNHLAFLFPKLPCGEPDPARRLRDVHRAMRERKRAGEPEGAAAVLDAVSYAPRPLRNAGRRVLSSPRLFNLIVSNVPGPPVPLFLMGCRVVRAYPAVPLIDGHGVSIGMTSVDGRACFGVYAQATLADDAERLVQGIDDAIGELLARCEGGARSVEPMAAVA